MTIYRTIFERLPSYAVLPTGFMPLPERTFEVTKAHLLRITAIDNISQTFTAQFVLEFAIRGAADDEHLWVSLDPPTSDAYVLDT